MSLQAALNFIRWFRAKLNAPDYAPDVRNIDSLEQMKSFAENKGWDFSLDELRQAHAYDWRLRWQKFCHSDSSPASDDLP